MDETLYLIPLIDFPVSSMKTYNQLIGTFYHLGQLGDPSSIPQCYDCAYTAIIRLFTVNQSGMIDRYTTHFLL